MEIKLIQNLQEHFEELSKYFRIFYEKEPWGDYKGCDTCFNEYDLNQTPRFKSCDSVCTSCGNKLSPFWTVRNCEKVLSESTLSVGLFNDKKLQGWILSETINPKTIAITFMGLDHQFRRRKPRIILLKEMLTVISLFYINKKITALKEWSYKKLFSYPIVSLHLYLEFELEAVKRGYERIESKTHKDAKNIFYALRSVGFSLSDKKLPDNRVLFYKNL